MNLELAQVALSVVDQISAIVGFWDTEQRCVFSNEAYREWFGKSREEMHGISMRELLGPVYELNVPHILAALRGEKQVFERQIRLPSGAPRECMVTYNPAVIDGVVRGFAVHVADVTELREREAALRRAIQEREVAEAEVRVLRGMLPTCAFCKAIRDEQGVWHPMEVYIGKRSQLKFTHSFCPACGEKHYPEYFPGDGGD